MNEIENIKLLIDECNILKLDMTNNSKIIIECGKSIENMKNKVDKSSLEYIQMMYEVHKNLRNKQEQIYNDKINQLKLHKIQCMQHMQNLYNINNAIDVILDNIFK